MAPRYPPAAGRVECFRTSRRDSDRWFIAASLESESQLFLTHDTKKPIVETRPCQFPRGGNSLWLPYPRPEFHLTYNILCGIVCIEHNRISPIHQRKGFAYGQRYPRLRLMAKCFGSCGPSSGRRGCRQLCKTNPIFGILGLGMGIELKNEAKRSQFLGWARALTGKGLGPILACRRGVGFVI